MPDERPMTELYDALHVNLQAVVAVNGYIELLKALEAIDKHSEREDLPDGEVIALIQGELDIVLPDVGAALLEALR